MWFSSLPRAVFNYSPKTRVLMKLDQYYTKPDDAKSCLELLEQYYPLESFDHIVEPSAGTGSFSDLLPLEKLSAVDLNPKRDYIQEKNFFDFEYPTSGRVLTIGNPPFGRRGSMVREFFEHAVARSSVIAFVLPAMFSKKGASDALPSKMHLIDESIRIKEFVLPNGETYEVNCVFQIWEKRNYPRRKTAREKTYDDFTIRHAHYSRVPEREILNLKSKSDFCINQIIGKITSLEEVESGSQYFIQDNTEDKRVEQVFRNADLTEYQNNATIKGMVSFSREDLVEIYKKGIKDDSVGISLDNFMLDI